MQPARPVPADTSAFSPLGAAGAGGGGSKFRRLERDHGERKSRLPRSAEKARLTTHVRAWWEEPEF